MDDPLKTCWSWTHLEPVPSALGHLVCEAHKAEEPKIQKILADLQRVDEAIKFYQEDSLPKRPHPSEAQVILEETIAQFFSEEHPSLRTGKAFRINLNAPKRNELDIIIDFDSANWTGRSRKNVVGSPPFAHMEITYRGHRKSFDLNKFKEDFHKIYETVISGAVLEPPKKIWTAFVGLGSGWKDRRDNIAQFLHESFHNQEPRQISIPKIGSFWAFPEIIVVPGLIFKGQVLSSAPGLIDKWPVYSEVPSARNDPAYLLRPLAVARGFFNFFIQNAVIGKLDIGYAWADEDSSSIFGPNARSETETQKVVCLRHGYKDPENLFAADTLPDDRTKFLHFRATEARCCFNKSYRYERQKGSPLDEIFLGGVHVIF